MQDHIMAMRVTKNFELVVVVVVPGGTQEGQRSVFCGIQD